MNDNEQNFSNTPYKAAGNLNTIIGNPDININSAVTSNIMEGNSSIPINSTNDISQNNFIESNNASIGNSITNLDPTSSSMLNLEPEVNQSISSIEEDPIQSFINKTNEVSSLDSQGNIFNQTESSINMNNSNNTANSSINNNYASNVSDNASSYVSTLNTVASTSNVQTNQTVTTSQVRYENAYQTDKKNKSNKKAVTIPNEFKTAIFVVLILLIIVSCFDAIYDFFRNLNIFG